MTAMVEDALFVLLYVALIHRKQPHRRDDDDEGDPPDDPTPTGDAIEQWLHERLPAGSSAILLVRLLHTIERHPF